MLLRRFCERFLLDVAAGGGEGPEKGTAIASRAIRISDRPWIQCAPSGGLKLCTAQLVVSIDD